MRCRTIQGELLAGQRHIQEREEGGGREVHTHLAQARIRHFLLITFDGSRVRTGAGLGINVWHLLSWQTPLCRTTPPAEVVLINN